MTNLKDGDLFRPTMDMFTAHAIKWDEVFGGERSGEKMGFILNGFAWPAEERTQVWSSLGRFTPSTVIADLAKQVAQRMTSSSEAAISESDDDLFLARIIGHYQFFDAIRSQPRSDYDDEYFRRMRMVDFLRVVDDQTVGGQGLDQAGWDEHYRRLLNFFNPENAGASVDRNAEIYWLQTFVFGYHLAWHEPDDLLKLVNGQGERVLRTKAMFKWFLSLTPERQREAYGNFLTFDKVTGLETSVNFYNWLGINKVFGDQGFEAQGKLGIS